MARYLSHPPLREVLRDIIEGKIVRRSKHELMWENRDLTEDFCRELTAAGYAPMTVRDVDVTPGQRVPAFYVNEATAYFGWVFWEFFTPAKQRKLFGSVVRNSRGDWAVHISPKNNAIIYVHPGLRLEMDTGTPVEFPS